MATKKQLAFIANAVCLMMVASPALSQSETTSTGTSITADDATKSANSLTPESTPLIGGVEQKVKITIPGAPATADRKALPELILEVPKLGVVPEVPKFLQAGTTFDQSLYPKEGNVWYRIPTFLAGHWTCNEKTILSRLNLATGKENTTPKVEAFISEINQGFQQDNTGQIWHFDLAPFLGHSIQPDGQTHYSFVQKIEPISSSSDKFVRRVILIKAEVNGSNIVKTSKQYELLQSMTPFDTDKIREDSVSRSIDPDGPGWRITSTTIFSLVKPYAALNQNKGRDMREMFREYLENNGMSDLVPKP